MKRQVKQPVDVSGSAVEELLEIELIEAETAKIEPISTNGNGSSPEIGTRYTFQEYYNPDRYYQVGNRVFDLSKICYEDIITEDDEPVDNFPSEKQQRLLVNPLYGSSHLPRPFVAAANVGVFYEPGTPAIVPDMFLSLNTSTVDGDDIMDKENRTYYVWKMKKPPEVVVEIVSNRKGNETDNKFEKYAKMGAKYYVILDHLKQAQDELLTVYELVDGHYELRDDYLLPDVNLSITFWENTFEDMHWSWIRWCNLDGTMILLPDERADEEKARADEEKNRADEAEAEAERIRQENARIQAEADRRVEEALAKLRAAGIEPDI